MSARRAGGAPAASFLNRAQVFAGRNSYISGGCAFVAISRGTATQSPTRSSSAHTHAMPSPRSTGN